MLDTRLLSELSNTLKLMAESQAKRHKKGLESDKKKDEALVAFKREEAQKNREHEIKLAEIYARIMSQPQSSVHPTQPTFSFSPTQSYRMPAYVNVPETPLRNQDIRSGRQDPARQSTYGYETY